MARRTRRQREKDLAELAKRYLLGGEDQAEIAEDFGVTQGTISNDLKELEHRWQASSLVDVDEARKREIAHINALQREYWQAWLRSKKDAEIKTVKESDKGKERKIVRKGQVGEIRFLEGIEWCIEQRAKIWGIYEPEKFQFIDWKEEVEQKGISPGDLFNQMIAGYMTEIEKEQVEE